MARVWLVRHGRAAAGFSDHHDPGLDDAGRAQAAAMAEQLAPVGPLPLVVSPLRRTRETAAALEAIWGTEATVDDRVAEIPSPTSDLAARGTWLRAAMAGTWADLGAEHRAWRDALVAAITDLRDDTVVVSHFIAINAVLGVAVGDDRVMHASVDNCSVTILDNGARPDAVHRGLSVVEVGRAAPTQVR